ncbi:MAG: molecular chaperone HtpG [Mucinivorans sp.]
MKKGNIGVTSENIFPIIKKFLYSDHEIFLREIVSNAVDATTKLKALTSRGLATEDKSENKVTVTLDSENKTITISDSGIGMNAEQVERYINQIAFSGAEEFLDKYKDTTGIIGHFGLGFYSAFLVSSSVEIISQSYLPDSVAVHWTCDGSPKYTLQDTTRPSGPGTDIILHIDDENTEYTTKERIEGLLTKYCRFLPVPIEFDGHQINDTTPLWTVKPAEITDQQYTEFYHTLYPMAEEPLFHIHLNVDYPFNLTGILYFPRLKNNFEVQKNKIQLYCNQVYVTDSVEGIVPEFLTLLHGVLDSPDIPLNVSRSYLQSDGNVKKISTHITKKVADRLADIFKNQRADYEMNWDELKLFIQYGVVSNEKFGDRATEFSLLKNTEGKYFSLEDYAASIKETQTDKNGKIIHLYTPDPVAQDSFIQAAKAKGYDVLVMDSPLEAHWIGFLEHKHTDWSFVRVDSAPMDTLIAKEKEEPMALSEDQQKEIEKLFQEVLPKQEDKVKYTVKVSAMAPDSAPMVITQDEFMRRMKDMSRVGGGGGMNFYGEIPDSYSVVVNGNHSLIVDLLGKESTEQSGTAQKLIELSLLQAGLLRGEALTRFIATSIEKL